MPELRQNIITGDWVVIAPERAKRPQDYVIPPSMKVKKKEDCPFCPESKAYKSEDKIRQNVSKNIYAIPNKYPAFIEGGDSEVRSYYPEKGFYRARPAIGDHEVIVVKRHDLNLITLPQKLLAELIEVIKARYLEMKKEEGVVTIMPIYNHGAEAGASIDHPHAQIFASGTVSNTIGWELEGAERYYGINGVCVFCDIIGHEQKEKVRIVTENDQFLAATFFASRFPMETWIYPKRHQSQFEQILDKEIESLAGILHQVLVSLNKTVPNLPLNFYIHTLPVSLDGSRYYHWHLEIVPRLSNFGGYELGSGVIINIMTPEAAAGYLREKIVK